MLVYISDVCNGGNFYDFNEKILVDQALQEKEKSALDKILPNFKGRTLISCKSAIDDFHSIVSVMGGPAEKQRSEELIKKLTIVPDCVSQRYANLATSGQIRYRSKVIFGCADTLKCDILTSNERFVRAAAGQGIHVPVIIHQPRALSEQKRIKFLATISSKQ